jgi:hypothetical protein
MVKVLWFLKRAEHLSSQEFADWWLNRHAHDVVRHQGEHLRRYVVNLLAASDAPAAGAAEEPEWDGVAEQWFDDEAAYLRAYSVHPSPTRGDTLAHTSRFARMVVTEHQYVPPPAAEGG